ncbi:P-loop NTPase [Alteribacillus sp. YIM 98480]|uniref:AAA family ATPase n=1 Tax=Alteribacillus sp. YIM 98480 TaxID=2606599 RepID=UPI00131B3EDB|nr:P-loop NTPase [Alteribacillus sp. YIM 98480]
MASKRPSASQVHRQTAKKMIAVCSATGGTGRTTLTVNTASLLAAKSKKVTAIDGDLQFGDLSLAMDIQPDVTIKDTVHLQEREKLIDLCNRHESGVRVLSAPSRPEEADLITEEHLDWVITSLKEANEYLLVDTAAGLNDRSLPFIENADHIVVVTTGGMAALKNAKLMIGILEELELNGKISVVVNRSTAKGSLIKEDLTSLLQAERVFYLPEDRKHVSHSQNTGQVLCLNYPRLEISKAIMSMAEELFPETHYGTPYIPHKRFQRIIQRVTSRRRK